MLFISGQLKENSCKFHRKINVIFSITIWLKFLSYIIIAYMKLIPKIMYTNFKEYFKSFIIYTDSLYYSSFVHIPSRMGFASRICCSIQECFPLVAAKYCRMSFVLSVFPAPLSPLMTMHWF